MDHIPTIRCQLGIACETLPDRMTAGAPWVCSKPSLVAEPWYRAPCRRLRSRRAMPYWSGYCLAGPGAALWRGRLLLCDLGQSVLMLAALPLRCCWLVGRAALGGRGVLALPPGTRPTLVVVAISALFGCWAISGTSWRVSGHPLRWLCLQLPVEEPSPRPSMPPGSVHTWRSCGCGTRSALWKMSLLAGDCRSFVRQSTQGGSQPTCAEARRDLRHRRWRLGLTTSRWSSWPGDERAAAGAHSQRSARPGERASSCLRKDGPATRRP